MLQPKTHFQQVPLKAIAKLLAEQSEQERQPLQLDEEFEKPVDTRKSARNKEGRR